MFGDFIGLIDQRFDLSCQLVNLYLIRLLTLDLSFLCQKVPFLLFDLALVLKLLLLHGNACQLKLVLAQSKLLLALYKCPRITLFLLLELVKLGFHLLFLALDSLFLLLLVKLRLSLLLLVLQLGMLHLLEHGCLLLLKLFLLLLVTFLVDPLLLLELAELHLVKGHVPINGLLVLHFLLCRVVCHDESLKTVFIDAIEAILLHKLPSQVFLVLPGHDRVLFLDLF